MTALTKTDNSQVAEYGDSILAIIAKAASDPNVDIDKMDRLLQMQERVQARQAKIDFDNALAAMQPELPMITKDQEIRHNGKLISNYADWTSISKAITPILSKHGFALNHRNSNTATEAIITAVLKRAGHEETNSVTLPSDTSGSKNNVQAIGSTTQYGLRYSACPLVGVTIGGDDDDGNAAGAGHPISVKQFDEIKKLMTATETQEAPFIKYLASKRILIKTIDELPATYFEAAKAALNAKVNK